MVSEQYQLEGVNAPQSAANRGKTLEEMLRRAHNYYARARLAWVYHIPNAWGYVSKKQYDGLNEYLRAVQYRKGGTYYLAREQTPCDYTGHFTAGGRVVPLSFDAKEFEGPSMSLDMLKAHQLDSLAAAEGVGSLAGFLVWSKKANRVYWLAASKARGLADKARFAPRGKVKGVLKSLSVAWLDENAVTLCTPTSDGLADYLPKLSEYRQSNSTGG